MIAASILEYTFITVTCNTRMYYMEYRIVWTDAHILAYASAFASASLPSKFQDVPGPGNFTNTITGLSRSWKFHKRNYRTFQVLEILHKQFQDIPGGVGTLCVKPNKPSMATGERSSWNSGL